MKARITAALVLTTACQMASAANLDTINALAQDEFRALSKDLTSALSYKAVAPAEAQGVTGFDIGVEVTSTEVSNSKALDKAMGNDGPSTLILPKLHAHKGLPFGIDVGAMYTSLPGSNISLMGGELRYALIDGGVAMPAVALRGTYTTLSGVDQLDFTTKGLELAISKGFVMFTPYAGIGNVWANSKANVVGLTKENLSMNKVFIGLNINLGLMNLAFEGDKTGENASYSAKLGVRF